jgi:protein tyrosine/serine phosphatase
MSLVARKAIKRLSIAATALTALTLAGAAGSCAYVESDGNVYAVDPGHLYRSRQLSGPELERAIRTFGIRSILNLRGPYPGRDWYDDEITISSARNLIHYDYSLSAFRRVSPEQLEDILRIIRDAPKPILIHCTVGADRTGLVSAVYLYSHGASEEEAGAALSLRYGHFPYLGNKTRAMDDSFHAYVIFSTPNAR